MNEAVKKLKKMCEQAGTQKAVAEELGITPAYLNDILRERREVSDFMAHKLGFEWRLIRVSSLPHPEGANAPTLVERTITKEA